MNTYGHVVDDEGKPLEVYHGTTKDFDKFVLGHPERKDVGWLGHGLYFTNSRDMAQANAQMKAKRVGGTPKVMSVNLSLQNPYYATLEDKARLQKANSSEASKAFTEALKSKGHDGVIWKSGDYHEYVAFDPDQVMIKKAEGGEVEAEPTNIPLGRAGRRIQDRMTFARKPLGITGYHGTPHTFAPTESNPLGEFDASKVGTGEGAQAYGHGLYLAEAPGVAKEYAVNLANRDMKNQGRLNAHANAQRLVKMAGDPKYAADDLRFALDVNPDHPQKELLLQTLRMLESGEYKNPLENSGRLYHVHIPDEMVDRMLHWDKPWDQQSAYVKKAIKSSGLWKQYKDNLSDFSSPMLTRNQKMRGENIHAFVEHLSGGDTVKASEALRQVGIPGIKYLDEQSRSAGKGTHNFVIFPGEERNLKIIKREAKGGSISKAGGGPVSLDAMRLALLNRPKMAEGGDVDSPFPRGRAQRRMAVKSSVGPQPLTISKEPGGQWIGGKFGGVEQVVNRYKQMGDATPEKQAVNNWLDTTLTKYMKRDFGTEKDPVRMLMEEGITHHENPEAIEAAGFFGDPSWLLQRRKQYGMPENLISKNVLAKKWESGADKMIGTSSAEELIKRHPYAVEMLSENPWIKKVDPKTKIHFFDTGLGGEINFRHLTDELHNSLLENSNLPQSLKLRPESLSRMSVPQAVRHVHKINEWRKDNRAESNLEKSINSAVHLHKDYPDSNLAWYEIKHPAMTADEQAALRDADLESIEDAPESLQSKYKALEEALQYEGDTMGHCVGGYADDVASGNSRIFSLRNKRTGEPHVTIETHPKPISTLEALPSSERIPMKVAIQQWRQRNPEVENLTDNHVREALKEAKIDLPEDIEQIKGKQNDKPVEKYIPFVQDFVKSGKWGRVGDVENTDLLDMENLYEPHRTHYFKNSEKYAPHAQAYQQRTGEYPRFLTEHEFYHPEKWNNETPVQKKADGGLIKETVMPTLAQMKMALSGRPKDLQSIGAQEAPDMTPKSYLPPDRRGMLPPGGVATPSGMPIGGIDMSQMPGQQLMPTNALQPQGGLPQGADQGSPVAPNAPQSNILQMTPQGQQMAAMTPSAPQQPQQPQQMQDGGVVQYPTISDGVFKAEDDQPGLFRATGMANGGSTKFAIQPPKAVAKTPDNFTPYDDSSPSIKKLTTAFNEAIAHHLSLSPEERVANSQRAAAAVAEHIGRTNTGKPKDLLGKNAKLMKTEKGNEEAIKLPDGRGVETTGLALSPAYQEKKFQTCPNHAACKAECLGKTSGGYFRLGGGEDLEAFKGPRLNSLRKTQAFLRDPHSFAVKLYDEIQAAKDMAAANGNHLGVRLNVLSDISPDVHESIIKGHPDVTFYDYTKNKSNPIASNHHYTYSSTGATQPGVENPNTNWKRMRQRLDNGDNVAMAFSHKEHLPHEVHDQETGKVYRVVDGDTHDFRPLDMQPEGEPGVIIGLKNKKATGKVHEAHKDSNGFFVHYDPQLKMNPNGTYERSPIPRVTKKGKPKIGETIPQNRRVNIIPQDKVAPAFDNDGEKQ